MAKASRGEMKQEALRCMELLNIGDEIRHQFEYESVVYLSYNAAGSARAFSKSEMDVITDIEAEQKIMIYHVIRNKVFGMDMLTMLTVSQEKDEWDGYFTKLESGDFLTYAYVQSDLEDGISSVIISPTEGSGVVRKG